MDPSKPNVLLTGFGPFPGVETNESAAFASDLAMSAGERFSTANFIPAIFATEWSSAPAAVREQIALHRPAAVLMFGVSGRATALTLESTAANVCNDNLDASGCRATGACVTPGGPETIATTWPIADITERLNARKIPWHASSDAGHYICNASLYEVLASAASGWGVAPLTGFIHIPRAFTPDTISRDQALDGCLEIIDVCLQMAARTVNPQPVLTVPPV